MNKRILLCYWGRKGGGAQYSKEIATEFVHQDSQNTYLSFSNQSDIIGDISPLTTQSFHIDTYESKLGFMLKTLFIPILIIRLLLYLKVNKINIVYTLMASPWTVFFIPFFKILKIKHILTVHDASIHPGDSKILGVMNHFLFTKSDYIVTLSRFVQEELVKNYAIDSHKIIKSVHGVFNYENMNFSQKNFNNKEKNLRIIFFGRIVKYKGLNHLIKAIVRLQQEDLNIIFEIYGSGKLDVYKKDLDKLRNLKLENRWIKDDEIYEIFDKDCINVCPYIEASQSGVIPVALSCGVPSIVTDFGALSEQVQNNITGIVIDIKDIEDNLYRAIKELYFNKNQCTELSKYAYLYSKSHLQWNVIVKELKYDISSKVK